MVDTNVLVHAGDQDSPFHGTCRASLERWRSQPGAWFVTWSVLYEFLRVSSHPRPSRRPLPVARAWAFVDALLTSPGLKVLTATSRHAEVARAVFTETPVSRATWPTTPTSRF